MVSYNDIASLYDNQEKIRIFSLTDDIQINIRHYLPIEDKAKLISFVVENSLDEATGCFSPVRTNVFFALGVLMYYTDIEFDGEDYAQYYDTLEKNGVIDRIFEQMEEDELKFVESLVTDTVEDIARYNNSFAGMLGNMSSEASALGDSVQDVLFRIKNDGGAEALAAFKDMVEND